MAPNTTFTAVFGACDISRNRILRCRYLVNSYGWRYERAKSEVCEVYKMRLYDVRGGQYNGILEGVGGVSYRKSGVIYGGDRQNGIKVYKYF
jgi:hypothetical protein